MLTMAKTLGGTEVLLQRQPSSKLKPMAYAIWSMKDTEWHYSQVEKEALALMWALELWRDHLLRFPKITSNLLHCSTQKNELTSFRL